MHQVVPGDDEAPAVEANSIRVQAVSYTHLRAHETVLDLVCRLLLEKKKNAPIKKLLMTHTHTIYYTRINELSTQYSRL